MNLLKKPFLVLLLIAFSIGCEDSGTIVPQDGSTSDVLADVKSSDRGSRMLSGCQATHGSGVYNKTGQYNCHQYVRAALLENGLVDLTTGEPDPVSFSGQDSYTIQSDSRFIRVCNYTDASHVAIAHLPSTDDHSALKLPTEYAYSYPGGTQVHKSGVALHYTTSCDYEYFAPIPALYISGPVPVGDAYKFTLHNKNLYPFLIADNARWSVTGTATFQEVSESDTEYIIKPVGCAPSTYTVVANIHTNATKNGACPKGVNNIEDATTFVPIKTLAFSIPIDCNGKLDGGTLNTFNSVSRGTHQVEMKICPLTWVKTSGSATWSTSNSGKNMTFTINGGSVSFNVYGLGCNRNVTFYSN